MFPAVIQLSSTVLCRRTVIMDSRILFHTPQSDNTIDSGSSVRPTRMINAFEELGYTVDKVVGDTQKRKQRVKDVRQNDHKYEFCYSEPTTWPLHPFVDYQFYWYLVLNEIPTGVFYRDIYWKFPELFDHSGLQYWQIQLRHRIDLAVISRIADQVYVPSSSFGDEIDINTSTKPLPPGGIDKTASATKKASLQRLIYVGGISDRYGSELLSEICESVIPKHNVNLDLVCRESEYNSLSDPVRQRFESDSVTVHHVSGDDLNDLYERADSGIIPLLPTQYNDFAVPVKLFEYISYGLPIITTNLDEVGSFVKSYDCGLVCENDPEELDRAIERLSTDKGLYQQKKTNAIQALRENRWIDRVETVVSDLVGTSVN